MAWYKERDNDGLEGLWCRDDGEQGVRHQQHEWKAALERYQGGPILDLGAHVGWFVWYEHWLRFKGAAAGLKLPACREFLCVEAAPRQLETLRLNYASNKNVRIVGAAVVGSDYDSLTAKIYMGKTYSSCDTTRPVRGREAVEVPVVTWRLVLEAIQPELVKIDIEGSEYDLDMALLPACTRLVTAELHHPNGKEFEKQVSWVKALEGLGFKAIKKPSAEPTFLKTTHGAWER